MTQEQTNENGAEGESLERSAREGEQVAGAAWRRMDQAHGFPDPLIEAIAARFRLLGEPLRLKLLATLADRERSVSELVELTGAGQPNVSKHLAALAQGGLITRRRSGAVALYSISDSFVLRLCDVVCVGVQESASRRAQAYGIEILSAPRN
ncbi:MAG TPA: metalloregulator ArsR/SmtB family transcription factor [Ktedonobacterales bacterium]